MNKIQKEIDQLMMERIAIKIEINSQYPTVTDFTDLVERRSLITSEVKRLFDIQNRQKKLKKIKTRIKNK